MREREVGCISSVIPVSGIVCFPNPNNRLSHSSQPIPFFDARFRSSPA